MKILTKYGPLETLMSRKNRIWGFPSKGDNEGRNDNDTPPSSVKSQQC